MNKPYVWLVETRAESNPHTGERKGPWYPCGWKVHRTKKEAQVEAKELGGPGPRRVTRYERAGDG